MWDTFQSERGSGWLQKLFQGKPLLWRIGFISTYGFLQPVLPAALFAPTTLTWHIIGILRSVGWYLLLPVLMLSFVAAAHQESGVKRKLWIWFSLLTWAWILLAALRGGGDQWDNPRYRAILFLWQAILAGQTLVWWRETRNPWFWRIIGMETVFLIFFGQWYANRYVSLGPQLSFSVMVGLILAVWILILAGGLWWDRRRRA